MNWDEKNYHQQRRYSGMANVAYKVVSKTIKWMVGLASL